MSSRRKLIHIIPTNKWGGVQTYAFDICRYYLKSGWDVMALTRNVVGVDNQFSAAGVRLLHAPVRGFFDVASAMTLARHLRREGVGTDTVIHTHRYRDAFTALIAKKLSKRSDIRIVNTRHSVRPGRDSWIFRKLYQLLDAHIFVSRMAYDGFMGHEGRRLDLPKERVHILHNSIFRDDFTPSPEPTHGPVVALYQGALVKGKGLETLIDAMELLKKVKLRLRISGTGNPDYLDVLRRRAMMRDVMDNIDWNIKVKPSLESCDEAHFGVIPSTEREAFSLESLRFMAAMRPQISTLHGAQSEYLKDGDTAFLVEPGNVTALAEAMRRLATDRELRLSMGYAAYKAYMREMSWSNFINQLNNIYLDNTNSK
ncbi:MAG: glycosyltransferase family 4 protein [Bacteroidales bacterium]|nr:glycosyltransferase family 4 protein [Bacteroidales bacterium]